MRQIQELVAGGDEAAAARALAQLQSRLKQLLGSDA